MLASLLTLPRWVYIAAGVVTLCLTLFTLHKCSVQSAVEADRAKASNKVLHKQIGAERAAQGETGRVKSQVEAENERARDAAKDSSDPLRDGLNSLRR